MTRVPPNNLAAAPVRGRIRRPRGSRRGGFTLVEALMSVVIVSGVLVAALGTFGAIAKGRQVQVDRAAAAYLAQQVVAEVVQCYYRDPQGGTGLGSDAGESARTTLDDVDDYENLTMDPPTLRDGSAMPGYAGWKVKVRVHYADLADPDAQSAIDTGLKCIRVSVTTSLNTQLEVLALRAADGTYEQAPYETKTYVTAANVSAKVGQVARTIHGGAHPLNGPTTTP